MSIDVKKITETLARAEDNERRLENLKNIYVPIADDLIKTGRHLMQLAKSLDPMVSIGNRKSTRKDLTPMARELYEKMQAGLHVTVPIVEKAYPELEKNQVMGVLRNIYLMPKVKKVKEAGKVRVYYDA